MIPGVKQLLTLYILENIAHTYCIYKPHLNSDHFIFNMKVHLKIECTLRGASCATAKF